MILLFFSRKKKMGQKQAKPDSNWRLASWHLTDFFDTINPDLKSLREKGVVLPVHTLHFTVLRDLPEEHIERLKDLYNKRYGYFLRSFEKYTYYSYEIPFALETQPYSSEYDQVRLYDYFVLVMPKKEYEELIKSVGCKTLQEYKERRKKLEEEKRTKEGNKQKFEDSFRKEFPPLS